MEIGIDNRRVKVKLVVFMVSVITRDIEHVTKATIIDAKQGEIAGTLGVDYSTSTGYGYAAIAGGYPPVSCIAPIGWYGGDSEDPAIKTLSLNAARSLTDEDSTPTPQRPE